MANIKISELNELTEKALDDYVPIVDTSADETKRISIENLVPTEIPNIENTYSESTNDSYSCNYINTSNEWKTLDTDVSTNTNVDYPSDFNEILVEVNVNTSATPTTNYVNLILSKAQIDTITGTNYKNFRAGGSYSSSFYFGVTLRAYATYITLTEVYNSGTLVNDNSIMNVYYR